MTWRALTCTAALCAALMPVAGEAQPERAEVRIKAAFLYKFSDFVEWPGDAFAAADSPFVIGVFDADAVADELAQVVANRTIHGRPVTVRRLRHGTPVDGVHMLFIGARAGGRVAGILAATRGRPTLTVTEVESADDIGSVINFVLVDDKVRFDVSVPPAEEGKLRISARLLAVARRVQQGSS